MSADGILIVFPCTDRIHRELVAADDLEIQVTVRPRSFFLTATGQCVMRLEDDEVLQAIAYYTGDEGESVQRILQRAPEKK